MKAIIKKTIMALVCLVAFQQTAMADNDKPITVNQLPAAAQQVIKSHFSGMKVALAKMETGFLEKSYDVIFTTGEKIEFDRNGNWVEIECKRTAVPAALIPAQIKSYVNTNYSGISILKIGKDRNEYEINLSNGVEIKFNQNFLVIDID